MSHEAVVVDRVGTSRGELVLRATGDHFEVISNGVFLVDTRGGRSERLLVSAALEAQPWPRQVLVGGLGVGFSTFEALADPRVERVTVVEIEQVLVDWHDTYLARFSGGLQRGGRLQVVVSDLLDHLVVARDTYDAVCIDVDNGPGWTVTDSNRALYDDAGTQLAIGALRSGGVLSVWSAHAAPAYEQRLRNHLDDVRTLAVPVARGEPDVVYVGRRRRSSG